MVNTFIISMRQQVRERKAFLEDAINGAITEAQAKREGYTQVTKIVAVKNFDAAKTAISCVQEINKTNRRAVLVLVRAGYIQAWATPSKHHGS